MTKPASAPPVDAEAIADSLMMSAVTDSHSSRESIIRAVQKALAASAQVRKVEPLPLPQHNEACNEACGAGCPNKPAAEPVPATINSQEIDSKLIVEPVPVAQGDALSSRLRPDIECAPWVIEAVKKLEAQLHDQRWQHAQELKRAEAAEASLAAYRETKPIAWLVTDGKGWARPYSSEQAADELILGAKQAECEPLFKTALIPAPPTDEL